MLSQPLTSLIPGLCPQGIFPVSYVHLKKSTVTNRG